MVTFELEDETGLIKVSAYDGFALAMDKLIKKHQTYTIEGALVEGKGANAYTTSKLNIVLKIVDDTKAELYRGPITLKTVGKKITDIKDVFDVELYKPVTTPPIYRGDLGLSIENKNTYLNFLDLRNLPPIFGG